MSPSEAIAKIRWSKTLSPGAASGSSRPRSRRAAIAKPDRVADALAERAGGGLHPDGVPVLRVAGGERAPGPQRLEVVELQPVPGQVELDVEGQAGVAGGQHEPVPAQPVGVGRVVPHDPLEQRVRDRGQAHRGAGMAVAGLLHRVHRQHPDQCRRSGCPGRSSPPGTPAGVPSAGPSGAGAGACSTGSAASGAGRPAARNCRSRGMLLCGRAGPCRPESSSGWSSGRAEPKILITASVVLHPPDAPPRRTDRRAQFAGRVALRLPGTYPAGPGPTRRCVQCFA